MTLKTVYRLCLLLSAMILFQSNTIAQQQANDSATFVEVGSQMIKFANTAQTGIMLEIAGAGLMVASAIPNVADPDVLIVSGAIFSLAGIITHIVSFQNMKKAGKIMMRIKPSSSGVGIAYTF